MKLFADGGYLSGVKEMASWRARKNWLSSPTCATMVSTLPAIQPISSQSSFTRFFEV